VLIFLLRVFYNESNEIPLSSVSITSQQQLLLKNRGNTNHEGLTRLQKARKIKGLSIADITRLTGLSYDNYIKYEREEVKIQYMNLETLKKLSDVFGIDLMTDYHVFKQNSAQNVKQYMEKHKLSIRKFAEICGVSASSVKQWRNGTCSPSYEIWKKFFK
jgi:transcriptional regulator with XRE-family HTH domain